MANVKKTNSNESGAAVNAVPENTTDAKNTKKTTTKNTKKDESTENSNVQETPKVQVKELSDSDEIKVTSLVPNVSYEDRNTGDFYEWENVDDFQYLTFAILKNMWRNHKKYFRNFVLKPEDDRVLEKFGLTSYFKQYENVINPDNYTKDNIKDIVKVFNSSNNDVKIAIERQIRGFVTNGKITDVNIIKQLQSELGFDLISYI